MEIRCHFEFWRESFHVEVLARCIKKKKGVEKFLRIHARCCNINTMSKVRLIVGAIEKKKKNMEAEDFLFQFYKFFDGNAEKLVIIDETWKSRILVNSSNFSRQRGRSWYTIYEMWKLKIFCSSSIEDFFLFELWNFRLENSGNFSRE